MKRIKIESIPRVAVSQFGGYYTLQTTEVRYTQEQLKAAYELQNGIKEKKKNGKSK